VEQESPAAPGLASSLRSLGATLLEAVGTRAELAFVELREEGERRKELLVLGLVGAIFLALGLLLAALFVVVLFWDSHRLLALGAVTLAYLGVALGAFGTLRRRQRESPAPFEATLRELAADRAALGGRRADE
jgi:uncharacterized membrane protein YqjE